MIQAAKDVLSVFLIITVPAIAVALLAGVHVPGEVIFAVLALGGIRVLARA